MSPASTEGGLGAVFRSSSRYLEYNWGMKLALVVLQGPVAGKKFVLRSGQIIGRLDGDIILQDPKVSGKHAIVEEGQGGELVLVDLGSTNGIKLNGQRVHTVTLNPGLKLQLGRSLVEIIPYAEKGDIVDSREQFRDARKAPRPKVEPAAEEPIYKNLNKKEPQPELEPLTWTEILYEHLGSKRRKIKDRPKVVAPFTPPITLTFLRGLQFETSWVLGYGPRKIGAKSIDLPIWEAQAPDVCFEIMPTPQGPGFKTSNSGMVLLNDKSTPAATLKSGDLISIFDCLIEVGFDEASE